MNKMAKHVRCGRGKIALLGALAFFGLIVQASAADQPKPGPEHKKLEARAGQWTYEGASQASPFGPADNFKGKATVRIVLGGFFLQGQEEDKGASGYVFQGVYYLGYDPMTRSYVGHGFENDGNITSTSATVSGNTWTSTGTRKDSTGKSYRTRSVDTYSADGKSSTFTTEYSPDDGKTWLPLWKGTMNRVK